MDQPKLERLLRLMKMLAANNYLTVEEIAEMSYADSLDFLSLENLPRMLGEKCGGCCDACFSGRYPAPVPDSMIFNKTDDSCMPIKRL